MSCPVCQKPVDALRARHVRIVGGHVTAYCSEACKLQDADAFGDVLASGRDAATAPVRASTQVAIDTDKSASNKAIPVATSADKSVSSKAIPVATSADKSVSSKAIPVATSADKSVSSKAIPVAAAVAVKSGRVKAENTSPVFAGDIVDETPVVAPREPAAPVEAAAVANDAPAADKKSMVWIVVGVIAIVGLAALAYAKLAGGGKPNAAPPMTQPTRAIDAAPPPDAPVAASAADIKKQALQVLAQLMDASAPRVQRVAAAALARTGDAKAIAKLQALIATEQLALAKLEMSYDIARGGDKSGRALLQQALTSTRRDEKGDAATLLVKLHDPSETKAVATLTEFLSISQSRLSAAEALASMKNPAAIKVLDDIAADKTVPADQRNRAIIALAHAGRRDVIPQLTKLLTDGSFNASAAIALAALGDASAAPVLRDQLRIASLQVEAARSLRKLSADVPPATLAQLAEAMGGDKDTARAGAAEAVLLLTGDAAWADFE